MIKCVCKRKKMKPILCFSSLQSNLFFFAIFSHSAEESVNHLNWRRQLISIFIAIIITLWARNISFPSLFFFFLLWLLFVLIFDMQIFRFSFSFFMPMSFHFVPFGLVSFAWSNIISCNVGSIHKHVYINIDEPLPDQSPFGKLYALYDDDDFCVCIRQI